jgi:dihydrodipicolinate synthase/N-acetylneuraminate lyase
MMQRLHGALAASVTPMRDGGRAVDLDAIEGLARFLAEGGVDGVLVCGTTGEGVLLDVAERREITEAFTASSPMGFAVAVHAGAQTSHDTIALAAHAQASGAQAVAVIAPPYFPLDDDELTRHLVGAANAADPLPFYVYEFAGRSGYAIPPRVVTRVRHDVFIGSEPLLLDGLAAGAVGCVSGLAAAFPEITAALVHERSAEAHEQVCRLRDGLMGIPFHAALKQVLVARDVLVAPDVRPPLRALTDAERDRVLGLAHEVGGI